MKEYKFKHSFSRKGNPYDNACIESFHATLKKEEIYLNTYQDFKGAKLAIFEYIESWYHRKRIHSALGYKTPQQVEDEAMQAVVSYEKDGVPHKGNVVFENKTHKPMADKRADNLPPHTADNSNLFQWFLAILVTMGGMVVRMKKKRTAHK